MDMEKKLTKEDLAFLAEAMDKMHGLSGQEPPGTPALALEKDNINGEMSVPEPVAVNVSGTMSKSDYEKCSLIMAVCTNMVQQTISNAAIDAGVSVAEAIKNMDAWVAGFVKFPFPFFTFKSNQSDSYSKQDFSLKADPDVVEKIVNIKNVPDLKDAVIGALKASEGEIASYSNQDRDFNYFGVITGYNETDIATRVIKYQLKMKNTDAKALCVTYKQTSLDSYYDTYEFVGDKYMMIKMQEALQDKLIEKMALRLLEFIDQFYEQQLQDYQRSIKDIIGGVLGS